MLRTAIARPVLMSPGEPGFVASNQSFLVVAIQSAPADEIRGIIDAAAADVFRLPRIGAKGTSAIDHIPREVRGDDSIRRDSDSAQPVFVPKSSASTFVIADGRLSWRYTSGREAEYS